VHHQLDDGGDTDQEIDDVCHHAHAENRRHEIPSERNEQPVEATDHEQRERDHMQCFHIKINAGYIDLLNTV